MRVQVLSRDFLLYNCGRAVEGIRRYLGRPTLTERDVIAIKTLAAVVSESVADEAKSLSERLDLSVEEVLEQFFNVRELFRKSLFGSLTQVRRKVDGTNLFHCHPSKPRETAPRTRAQIAFPTARSS